LATFLLCIICTIYIGLGVPDSALGSAWPDMYVSLNIPVGYQSILSMLISLSTVLASFFSARIIKKLGTGPVTALSTITTAGALLGFALSPNVWWIMLFCVPLGFGAGAIDAAVNNYVSLHYKPTHMNFMHGFYGLGVALSPFIMSFTLSVAGGWRVGYKTIFFIQAGLAVLSVVALPLWNKVKSNTPEKKQTDSKILSTRQMLKMPAVRSAWFTFFFATALEFTCDIWASTYLVLSEGLNPDVASLFLTLYFVGIMASRFIVGFVANKISCGTILKIGYIVIGVALIGLFTPVPPIVKGVLIVLIGFGIGPTFPNLIHATPNNFGADVSPSIVGFCMVACNTGIMIMPPLFGLIAKDLIWLFPAFALLTFLLTATFTFIYNKRLKPLGKKL